MSREETVKCDWGFYEVFLFTNLNVSPYIFQFNN